MRNVHYIGMGTLGCSYIYYSKIDKLYCILEKGALNTQEYKSISYNAKQAIGGIFMLLILVLFYHTPYLKVIFSLNIWQCIMISVISGVLYRNTIVTSKLEKFSKMKLTEVPFEDAINGHYNAVKEHTAMTWGTVILLYATIVICWINKFEIFISLGEVAIPFQFLIFILFIVSGILVAISGPIGRIKLMCRIHKEKRRLKKEKRALRK